MPAYTVSRGRNALSTSADFLTIVASATKPLRIYVVDWEGLESASNANEIGMYRSTGGTTPGGGITPTPNNPGSAAAAFNAYTTWSVQPTLGAVMWRFGPNGNGGVSKATQMPGLEWSVPVGGQVSFRSNFGVSNVLANLQIEEIDG